MSDRAPDMLGEVIAWRAWRVIGTPKLPMLSSVSVRACIWHPDRWTLAECRVRGLQLGRCPNPAGDGRIPSESCTCGLYAARDREQLVHLGYNRGGSSDVVFIGQVGMTGKVIPGTQGWRAEKARIVRLFVPFEHYRYVAPLEALYRVPVVLDNTLSKTPTFDVPNDCPGGN